MNEEQFAILSEQLACLSRIEAAVSRLCRVVQESNCIPPDENKARAAEAGEIVDGFELISSSSLSSLIAPGGDESSLSSVKTTRIDAVETSQTRISKKRKRQGVGTRKADTPKGFPEPANVQFRTSRRRSLNSSNDHFPESATVLSAPLQKNVQSKAQGSSSESLCVSSSRVKKELDSGPKGILGIYNHRCIRRLSPGDMIFLKPLPSDNAKGSRVKRAFRLCKILNNHAASDTAEIQWWETNSNSKLSVSRKVAFYPAWATENMSKEKYANNPDSVYCRKMWSEIDSRNEENVLLAFDGKMRRRNFLPLSVVKAVKDVLATQPKKIVRCKPKSKRADHIL